MSRWKDAGLVLATLVTAVLIGLVLWQQRQHVPSSSGGQEQPASESSTQASSTATTTPTEGSAERVLVAGVSRDRAWVVRSARSCDTGADAASVRFTTDGGRTWQSITDGPKVISTIRSLSDSTVEVMGLADDCRAPGVWRISQGGAAEKTEAAGDAWYIDPLDATKVHHGGDTVRPCGDTEVTDLAGGGVQYALCADGRVMKADGSASFAEETSNDQYVAVATAGASGAPYVVTRADCGLAYTAVGDGENGSGACVDGASGELSDISGGAGAMWMTDGRSAWHGSDESSDDWTKVTVQ